MSGKALRRVLHETCKSKKQSHFYFGLSSCIEKLDQVYERVEMSRDYLLFGVIYHDVRDSVSFLDLECCRECEQRGPISPSPALVTLISWKHTARRPFVQPPPPEASTDRGGAR